MTSVVIGDGHVAFADALAAVISEGDRYVEVASTAAEVVAAVGDTTPDLCLLDRWFADGDALDLLAGLRERSPQTKIIVLTADPDRDGAQQALGRGTEGFVHKTRGVSALLGAIERVLAGATVVELPPRWSQPRRRPMRLVEGPAEQQERPVVDGWHGHTHDQGEHQQRGGAHGGREVDILRLDVRVAQSRT